MSLTMNTSLSRLVRPKEILVGGTANAARGGSVGSFTRTVGAASFTSGGVPTVTYGSALLIENNIYFHMVMYADTVTPEYKIEGYLSVGPNCENEGNPASVDNIRNYLAANNYSSLIVKKRNNGSLGVFLIPETLTPLGNYVKVFEGPAVDVQFEDLYAEPRNYYGVQLSETALLTTNLGLLREGKLHIKPSVNSNLKLHWKAAYNADSNEEVLWLLDEKGDLLSEIRIYETDLEGDRTMPMEANKQYTLVIPGYSYRNYDVTFEEEATWVFEPVKLHFLGTMGTDTRWYFKLNANEAATFCMKDYNSGPIESPYGATLTCLYPDTVINMVLEKKPEFYEFDSVVLPVFDTDTIWKVDIIGAGRTGMWLDGVPNYFTWRSSKYFRPVTVDNTLTTRAPTFSIPNEVGKMPYFSHYHGYQTLDKEGVNLGELFLRTKPQSANIYTILDVIERQPNFEDIFREEMTQVYGIKRDYTICAMSGRIADLDFVNNPIAIQGLNNWIDNIHRINDGQEHYIAPIDEPNLNFADFESYRETFEAFCQLIKNNPKSEPARIKIAAPASSRFTHGTTIDNALNRKGSTWGQQIIDLYPEYIDAITWHDWTVHGLLNVRQVTDDIVAAYKLSNNGARRLALEQLNTSGGSSVSLYDQNTQIAQLWWAGTFIAATRTGVMDDVIWFLDQDDEGHPKGLFYSNPDAVDYSEYYSMKMVGLFQEWFVKYVTGASIGRVYYIAQPKLEVDMTCFSNVKDEVTRQFIWGVNKANRNYTVTLDNFTFGNGPNVKLDIWKPDGTAGTITPTINTTTQTCTFVLPPETIFVLSKDFVE